MGMLSLRKPSVKTLIRFLESQKRAPFSYAQVGASATTSPPGFVVDQTRIRLGTGEDLFDRAKTALRRWEQFNLGWVDARSRETPIEPGRVVAVMGHAMGLWWLNACRIIYVLDESGSLCRFGFAYGTLPAHIQKGEERFLVEWNQHDDSVWFDILAFSTPNKLLTRLGYPEVRRSQKRFSKDAAVHMFRTVSEESLLPEVCQTCR